MFIMLFICVNIVAMGQTESGKKTLEKAEGGDAQAQYMLASYYERGKEGFDKNEAKALSWYTKSANKNYIKAITMLRYVYEYGKLGQAKNTEKFIGWTRKAAEAGDHLNMADLGYFYKNGMHGLEKNEKEFLRWTKPAAEANYENAMYQLGVYYKEKGEKDEAIKWLKKCVDVRYEQSNGMETHDLALMDLKALRVNYDPSKKSGGDVEPKDGMVDIYDRLGRKDRTCKVYNEGGKYKIKVDNRLYPIKVFNKKIKGVTYAYVCPLFDAEFYIKNDLDLPSVGSSKSSSARPATSGSTTTSSKKKTTTKKSSKSDGIDKVSNKLKKLKKKLGK